jgi:hypothetical protein
MGINKAMLKKEKVRPSVSENARTQNKGLSQSRKSKNSEAVSSQNAHVPYMPKQPHSRS